MTEQELRNKVVATARGYVGCKESNGSHKKIIDRYNSHKPLARGYAVKYTDEWCATFVSAVAIECGLTDIMPTECSCSKMTELYKAKGCWRENDAHIPSPGDIVMYDWQDKGSGDNAGNPDHVGIVAGVSGAVMTIIEGNKNEAVAYRSMNVNGKYIRGYCLPAYSKKATVSAKKTTVTLQVLEKGSVGDSVKALQTLLNGYGFNCGSVDGSFGPATLSAVKAYQKSMKLTVDGSVGPKTWGSLLT